MKRLISFLLCFILLCASTTAFATSKNLEAVTAPTYLLADGSTDAVMLEENCTTNVGVNNFAKIMTAILSIEKFAPTDLLTFTEQTNVFYGNPFGNIAYTKPGQRFTVLQHLQNMLLLYSDSSAVALSVAHSGSTDAFVEQMNRKAAEIGMKNTVFTSPDGYNNNDSSKTTVYDLYLLMRYAMRLPLFCEIMETVQFTLPSFTDASERLFSSRNHLLSKYTYSTYVYSGVCGGMISYSKSGASFIGAARRGNKYIYAIAINTPDNAQQVYKDVINLFEHGFNTFHAVILAPKGSFLYRIPVKNAMEDAAVLVADRDVSALLPYGYDAEQITYTINAPESLKAPIEKGTAYATAVYYYGENKLSEVQLIAEKSLPFNLFGGVVRLFSGINTWLLLFVLVLVILFLYCQMKKQHKKEELRRRKREIMNKEAYNDSQKKEK